MNRRVCAPHRRLIVVLNHRQLVAQGVGFFRGPHKGGRTFFRIRDGALEYRRDGADPMWLAGRWGQKPKA